MTCSSYEVAKPGMFCEGDSRRDANGDKIHTPRPNPFDPVHPLPPIVPRLSIIIHGVRTVDDNNVSSIKQYCQACCPVCNPTPA